MQDQPHLSQQILHSAIKSCPMHLDDVRAYCLSFPQATENLQWGDDLCFKVRGKIFVTIALTAVPQKVCFKCTPESFAELTEREDIRPAPYVGRYNWVLLDHLDAVGNDELRDFIRLSYEMAAAKAPSAAARPKKRRAGKARRGATRRRKP